MLILISDIHNVIFNIVNCRFILWVSLDYIKSCRYLKYTVSLVQNVTGENTILTRREKVVYLVNMSHNKSHIYSPFTSIWSPPSAEKNIQLCSPCWSLTLSVCHCCWATWCTVELVELLILVLGALTMTN